MYKQSAAPLLPKPFLSSPLTPPLTTLETDLPGGHAGPPLPAVRHPHALPVRSGRVQGKAGKDQRGKCYFVLAYMIFLLQMLLLLLLLLLMLLVLLVLMLMFDSSVLDNPPRLIFFS